MQYCASRPSSISAAKPRSSVFTPGAPCHVSVCCSKLVECSRERKAHFLSHIECIRVHHDIILVEEGRAQQIQVLLLRGVAICPVVGQNKRRRARGFIILWEMQEIPAPSESNISGLLNLDIVIESAASRGRSIDIVRGQDATEAQHDERPGHTGRVRI